MKTVRNYLEKNFIFLLILIFAFALFLRVYKLSVYPVGFQIDEASLGYNAYSMLLTGRDEANHFLPLYIDTFGDNRPSGYFFLAIPSVAVFGLTEFATRFPGALFGAASTIAIFLLSYSLFQNKKVSLLSSLLLAISPWSVVLSRASAETIVALFFILCGFAAVVWSLRKSSLVFLVVGSISLIISFFFYHTPRVFVPFFFLILLIYLFPVWKKTNNRSYKKSILGMFFGIAVVAFSLVFLVQGGTGRFSQVNIFGFPETKLVMAEQIREDGVAQNPVLVTRIIHNKLINYSLTFISNYLDYFTGQFLFIKGGLPIWYKVDRVGLIYLVELPVILYGIYKLAQEKERIHKILLLWLFAAPVTAAVTMDDIPNLQRAIAMFPVVEIIAAFGIYALICNLKVSIFSYRRYITCSLVVIFFVFNFFYFLHQYFVHSKTHQTWYRNNGFSEMMSEVNKVYNDYDKIILTKTGGGYPLVLFYSRFSPFEYQKEGSPKDPDYGGFGKFIFVPQACPSINGGPGIPSTAKKLFVDRGDCPSTIKDEQGREVPLHLRTKIILREDKTAAFRIVYP